MLTITKNQQCINNCILFMHNISNPHNNPIRYYHLRIGDENLNSRTFTSFLGLNLILSMLYVLVLFISLLFQTHRVCKMNVGSLSIFPLLRQNLCQQRALEIHCRYTASGFQCAESSGSYNWHGVLHHQAPKAQTLSPAPSSCSGRWAAAVTSPAPSFKQFCTKCFSWDT